MSYISIYRAVLEAKILVGKPQALPSNSHDHLAPTQTHIMVVVEACLTGCILNLISLICLQHFLFVLVPECSLQPMSLCGSLCVSMPI